MYLLKVTPYERPLFNGEPVKAIPCNPTVYLDENGTEYPLTPNPHDAEGTTVRSTQIPVFFEKTNKSTSGSPTPFTANEDKGVASLFTIILPLELTVNCANTDVQANTAYKKQIPFLIILNFKVIHHYNENSAHKAVASPVTSNR